MDLNSYPTTEDEATADNLARYLTSYLTDTTRLQQAAPGTKTNMQLAYAVVWMLRDINHWDADEYARDIWQAWQNDTGMNDTILEWAAEYAKDTTP